MLMILQFILAFCIMITLHELGHFIASRCFGIEVEEFGIGLPPRLCRLFTAGGTEFTLNWLPFGAFVRPKGENVEDGENSLKSAAPWKQAVVCLAGPAMNLLTAAILFIFMAFQIGQTDISKVLIDMVEPQSPAFSAGMQAGDQLLEIADETIQSFETVSNTVARHLDREIPIVVMRDGEEISLLVTPSSTPPEGQGAMGIVITYPIIPYSVPGAINAGFQSMFYMAKQYVTGLIQLISGDVEMGMESIVGPVGMFSYYEQVANMDEEAAAEQAQREAEKQQSGQVVSDQKTASDISSPWLNRLNFFAVISIALGITNLFPIPALDGGRILFLLPEIFFKKRIPEKIEMGFNSFCMVCLLALMAVIMFKDIFMISNG